MGYLYSACDNSNLAWFKSDSSRNTLKKIMVTGSIRGIQNAEIDFEYPITTFVGVNGSGKSTILSLAACAYHNNNQYQPLGRKKKYYTFGDFFTFSSDETGIADVSILYHIHSVNGVVDDIRKKKPSGKWNDYNTRKMRNVAFLGINRILPASESSVHKNYKKMFEEESIPLEQKAIILSALGKIFGNRYEDFVILQHNGYRLYKLKRGNIKYSGFNMGAGENAVIHVLIELLRAGNGALLIIDEIELGLHISAQREFINVLKELCKDMKSQIICSSHSTAVIDALPPMARYYISLQRSKTELIPGITSEYATGKLACTGSNEIDIFVEDKVGKTIIQVFLPAILRERINIIEIGSDQAIVRQLASRYREARFNCIATFDGDKRVSKLMHKRQISLALENRTGSDYDEYVNNRLFYLPGNQWPERSLIEGIVSIGDSVYLAEVWDTSVEDVDSLLERALAADKHDEFYTISRQARLPVEKIRGDIAACYKKNFPNDVDEIVSAVRDALNRL